MKRRKHFAELKARVAFEAISIDGKGRWIDNGVIERFSRTIKYEDVYLKSYENLRTLSKGFTGYLPRYNSRRPHESLSDSTPDEVNYEQQRKVTCKRTVPLPVGRGDVPPKLSEENLKATSGGPKSGTTQPIVIIYISILTVA